MDIVRFVEHRVTDRGGQAIVPESAIAEERDRALVGLGVERRGSRTAEAVAHRGRADVERRQDREQVTADIAAHMMGAELAFDQLQGREDRPLRTAGAERGRARMYLTL